MGSRRRGVCGAVIRQRADDAAGCSSWFGQWVCARVPVPLVLLLVVFPPLGETHYTNWPLRWLLLGETH